MTPSSTPAPLTARQSQVLSLVALGLTLPDAASVLAVAHSTVRTHARDALARLGARTLAHGVALALANDGLFVDCPGESAAPRASLVVPC